MFSPKTPNLERVKQRLRSRSVMAAGWGWVAEGWPEVDSGWYLVVKGSGSILLARPHDVVICLASWSATWFLIMQAIPLVSNKLLNYIPGWSQFLLLATYNSDQNTWIFLESWTLNVICLSPQSKFSSNQNIWMQMKKLNKQMKREKYIFL